MSDDPAVLNHRLQLALRLLAVAGIGGTTVELAMLRHWTSSSQIVAWGALAVLAVALALTAIRPTPARLRVGQWLAAAVALSAAFGVVEHIRANLDAGPLDFRYTARWPTMSTAEQWWAATTGAVGPSPALPPAILAQTAAFVVLASIGRLAVLRAPRATQPEPLEVAASASTRQVRGETSPAGVAVSRRRARPVRPGVR